MVITELVEQVTELVGEGRVEDGCKLLSNLTPQDIAEVLMRLSNSVRKGF